jgi:alanyl-tRNA synthetase
VTTVRLSDLTAGIPPTELVYLSDSYQRKCESQVLKVAKEKKKRIYLSLDQTIFHPKGGGQPSDQGILQSASCTINVRKAMFRKGIVIHYGKILQGAIDNDLLIGEIDWPRRYEFMKRHTAGHLLDHCLTYVTGTPVITTDSWLGDECYVAYQGKVPSDRQIKQVVHMANEWINKGRPVILETVSAQELLRRAPDAPNMYRLPDLEAYRIVTIKGGTAIPCAGTHIQNIREIERVVVSKIEQRDHTFRIYYNVYQEELEIK